MSEENYCKDSVDAVRLPGPYFPEDRSQVRAGQFVWDQEDNNGCRCLWIVLPQKPGAHLHIDSIKCHKGEPLGERVWGWDGNLDAPTLTPSIHWPGVWHGFLRAGRLVSC